MNCTGKNCPMQYDKVDPATCPAVPYCQYATPPKTNADRIRAMSDVELADFLVTIVQERFCAFVYVGEEVIDGWLDWLKKGVEE